MISAMTAFAAAHTTGPPPKVVAWSPGWKALAFSDVAMHAPIGKASFDEEKLLENLATLVGEVSKAKPEDMKGVFVKSITLTTTMGPAIRLDPTPTMALTAN